MKLAISSWLLVHRKKQAINNKPNILNQSGLSILEVILASALFVIFATGSVRALLQNYNTNRLGAEYTVANQFASEGLEAVRSIKNQSFANLVNTAGCGLIRNGSNVWAFQSPTCTNNTLVHSSSDNYIRTIKVEPVDRDDIPPAGNIVFPGGTLDPDTKKITSTVTWNFNSARPETLSLVAYLSDWIKPIVGGGPIMMAYSKTTTTPFYRIWNGTAWSAEGSTQIVGGNINYIVLKSSRTRNESVLGTLDSNGNIYAQVWNGSSWGILTLMANVGSANATTRSFDIAYEKNGDRLVMAYLRNSTSADFEYRIWDGSTWSSPITVSTPPTTGVIKWIDMTQNPLEASNEIAMIMIDANIDVYGMVWTGSSWSNMGVSAVWDASAAIATEKAIDVAYEQNSGRAMLIWGDSVATDQYYRIWNGTSLTSATLLDIATSGGVANWIELVSRPNSDELLYGVLDAGSDINTRKWSGTGWDTATEHPRHTQGAENNSSMVFDLIWETHSANPGKAWLMYGNGSTVTKKQWSGSAWGSGTTLTGSDDTSFIRLKADPVSGAIFAGIYESAASATDDIWESRLTGGGTTWSAKNTIWAGPVSAEPVYFRVDISAP